jgi:hypothetical protein
MDNSTGAEGPFASGGIYSRWFLQGKQPLLFSLGHCLHLVGRNRQQGWPSYAQALLRCNGGSVFRSMIQGKPSGLIANSGNLWMTTLCWLLHQWCYRDWFHMAWRKFNIRGWFVVRSICAAGEASYKARSSVEACDIAREVYGPNLIAEIFAGTVVAAGGTILLGMSENLSAPVFSVATCMSTSVYYSVGRRLSLPGSKKDQTGEDLFVKKWSKIFGITFALHLLSSPYYWF